MTTLSHRLDRTVVIRADRDIVFRYFTDSTRWAAWWGAGSTIDPKPGGRVYIRYANGVEASGEVTETRAPERIAFTLGYASGTPMAPGTSQVTIHLAEVDEGTELHLEHTFADAAVRDMHVQGWRYQLSLFANVVADEIFAAAATSTDDWFALWTELDAAKRLDTLARIASADVSFRDRFSMVDGADDVNAHIAGSQRFMPGVRLERHGDARHCQGTVIVDWIANNAEGQAQGSGTNVFTLAPDGRIQAVTGFWTAPSK